MYEKYLLKIDWIFALNFKTNYSFKKFKLFINDKREEREKGNCVALVWVVSLAFVSICRHDLQSW